MEILKTLVLDDSVGQFRTYGTILYKEQLWFVPEWIVNQSQGWKKPKRMVLLTVLGPQKAPAESGADFFVSRKLPTYVFGGEIPKQLKDVGAVLDHPDLKIPIQDE